ncbi:MAG: flavin reductase family protein [Desulfurococcus sp.]|nr:flavin reductase family protein [Desulfurococcus sp.]
MSYRLLYPLRTYLISSGVYPEHYDIMAADWVTVVSAKPFIIAVSISPERYTYRLVKTHRELVVAVPVLEHLSDVWVLGSESGPSKLSRVKLKLKRGAVVKAPVIEDAVANLECRVVESKLYGDHELFIAEVVYTHRKPEVFTGGEPSLKYHFILHLARDEFTTIEGRVYKP